MRYGPRDLDIVWECTDNEVLLIDLKKGVYYSFREGTALLLLHLLDGWSEEETVEALSGVPAEQLKNELSQLVTFLLHQELMIEEPNRDPTQTRTFAFEGFPAPESYDDMAEIFEMDPIHDGDLERGWPVPNTP